MIYVGMNLIFLQLNKSMESHNIIYDCINIDMEKLEEIYSRLVFYNTLKTTFETVNELMENVDSRPVQYCAWINDRVFDNCNDRSSTNSDHLNTLNTVLCNRNNLRPCRPKLCLQK